MPKPAEASTNLGKLFDTCSRHESCYSCQRNLGIYSTSVQDKQTAKNVSPEEMSKGGDVQSIIAMANICTESSGGRGRFVAVGAERDAKSPVVEPVNTCDGYLASSPGAVGVAEESVELRS